ncbi:heme ABC transporter ATP-binding protein [Salmonirosea aquatica]|uniref:Heme ABC transporter ATP-binding protein n=1 Tax=Salmonirosea aquatica TaxID=2654236 RepID=A0A7C9FPW5_9BACT|nr:heme ABC transporter ATP-binding protein [Cytophagaceae bacterium SJW1-29]
MLEAKNISFRISGRSLLDAVSVQFHPGRINLIIGPNGAGKSTLVKILCGQLKPTAGEVFYQKEPIARTSVATLARSRAVLSQNVALAFPLTVAEVVMMGRYPHFTGRPTDRDRAACEAAMRFFAVNNMAARNYMTLSGGEKQRTHFARVTAQIWYPTSTGGRYLILDEPLTFLDVYYQFDFMNKLAKLAEQQDLVIAGVVHDLNLAGKYADHVVLLHEGKVLSSGTKESVLTSENIRAAYHMEVEIQQVQGGTRVYF